MRCPTCGERLAPTDERCPVCGAAVHSRLDASPSSVPRCPRCSYTGEGVAYFRRPGHLALLVGVSLFTYGVGGLVYWLLRRGATVCPNCGFLWEGLDRVPSFTGEGEWPRTRAPVRAERLPSSGLKRRVLGSVMVVIASMAIVGGIVNLETWAIAAGSVLGTAGSGMFFWGWRALQDRRAALTQSLERRVLQLATQRGGTLTVTDVAAELDLSLPAAEKVLVGMDDGFRVTSDVTDEGILLFEFPEVQLRRLDPPDSPRKRGA